MSLIFHFEMHIKYRISVAINKSKETCWIIACQDLSLPRHGGVGLAPYALRLDVTPKTKVESIYSMFDVTCLTKDYINHV